jgi:putative ABC transport system permease protein
MSQLLATLRRRPGPLVGTFVVLVLAALLVTVTATLVGTGLTLEVPAQRLAATTVVVTGKEQVRVTSGRGTGASTDTLALPAYRRVPAGLTRRLSTVPGVAAAVADVSIPEALELPSGRVATGGPVAPITGHGWSSAALAPFVLSVGHPPTSSNELVIGTPLAKAAGLAVGDTVRLVGQDLAPFVIVGLAGTPPGNPADHWSIFFTDAEAARLYGHPGQADLIGIVGRAGVSSTRLAARVRARLETANLTVLTGAHRGQAENLAAASDKVNLWQLATSAGLDVVLIALFVVASTVALSVAQRWRNIALLRAIGATPAQIRRMLALELAVLGALAGLVGYLPGTALASVVVRGLASHQLVPPSTAAWTSPWVLPIAVGTGMLVAELAGFAAARRASRISPVAALSEATVGRRRVHPFRLLLGFAVLAGGVALCVVIVVVPLSLVEQVNLALAMGLAFMVAVALLGPLVVSVAELLLRLPVRLISGVGGRLALSDIEVRPRRTATAAASVALGIAFVGAIYFIDTTQAHAAVTEGRQRLLASVVVTAPGPGLAPSVLGAITAQPGVSQAVGITPTTVFVPYPGNEDTAAEAVTQGQLGAVLDLGVIAGSLDHLGPGDIALSKLVAGRDAIGTHVGATITTYLADGTPYRAKVVAIYARSLGFGDAIVPAAAGGGGHLGTSGVGEVAVRASGGMRASALSAELATLAARYPGLHAASRRVVNAEAQEQLAQTTYANNLLLTLIAGLAGLALVNTLVMATLERRESIRLLRRVGATTRQLLSMSAWQTLISSLVGVTLGAAGATAIMVAVSRALTGSWTPYVTWPPIAVIVGTVLVLTTLSIIVPTSWMLTETANP